MKKFLSLFISYIMLFNITVPVFAQNNKTSNSQNRMTREMEVFSQYTNVIGPDDPRWKYFSKADQERYRKIQQSYNQQAQKNMVEITNTKEYKVAQMLGADFAKYKATLEKYAKSKGENVNVYASWGDYIKELNAYNDEYLALVKKFMSDNSPYEDIRSEISWALSSKKEKVSYDGKEYSIDAFLHAAIHNLVTRKGNGRMEKGMWVFSEEKEGEFSVEDKLTTMPYIYNAVAQYGYYPKDREYIWAFAYEIVANGKKYFDNDTYKADLFPNIASNEAKQKRDTGNEKRSRQASAVATAMALLPIISEKSTEIESASEAIYQLMNDVLGILSTYDYASVAIVTGASALIAFNKEASLSRLLTYLTEDCKKGKVKGFLSFVGGLFSAEEWTKGIARAADIHTVQSPANNNPNSLELTGQEMSGAKTTRVEGGYSYYNSLSITFSYIDKSKTPFNEAFLAGNSGGADAYYNVIFTDIFEEIGRELGSNASSSVVKSYINTFANRLSNKGFNKNFSDDDLTISIVTGILQTAPKGNTSLRYAADLIYSGSWWDLNEATQRDKNNIAAEYLGKPKKEYNKEKDEAFKKIFKAKYASTYVDMVTNAVMVASLIYSAPAIIKGFAKWTGKSVNKIKDTAGKIKNVRLSTSSRVGVKPVTTRAAASTTATRTATTAGRTATTAGKTAASTNTATNATRAATGATTAGEVNTAARATQAATVAAEPVQAVAKTQAEILAEAQAQASQAFDELEKSLFGEVKVKKPCNRVACSLVPGLPIMDVELPSFAQILNNSPKLKGMYKASREAALKAMETQGLTVEEAQALFVKDLSGRFNLSPMTNAARKASILDEAAKAFKVSLEPVAGAESTVAKAAAKSKSAIKPVWTENKGFSSDEIKALSRISEDIGVEEMNFLVEQGLSPKEISYLNSKHPNSIRNNFSRTKQFLSEGGSFSDLKAVLEGKPTFSELMGSMNNGTNSRVYTEAEKGYISGTKGSSSTASTAKPTRDLSQSFNLGEKPAAAKPTKALSMEEKKAAIQKIGKGNNVARLEARGLLDDAYFSQTETLAKRGVKDDLIKELKDKGLLEAGNFQKVENMLDLGVKPERITRMKGYGFFDEPLYSRYTETAKKVTAKGGSADFVTKDLLSDAKYPKTKALLDKGVDIKEIYNFNEQGILDAKYAELAKSTDVTIQGSQTVAGAGGKMTTAQKVQYLESKGLSSGQISFYEKNILNNEQYFQRAKTLIDKGFDPMEVAANRTTILEGSNFERVQKLSSSEFNKLANEGLFANSNYAVTEKLLEKGYKADDIIKFSKSKSFAGVSPESYVSNLERQATGQNFLAQKGWFEMDAFTLEKAGFGTEKSYAKIESILSKGVSRQDVLALVDEGLLEEEYFAKVSTLLDYKISPSDIKMLRNNGALQKEYSTLQYLLQHKGNAQTITMLNNAGLLDDFAITKTWLQKGFKFNEMETLHAIRADFYTTDIAAQVDFLVEKGFSPSQIENLYRANKLNNNLNRIQTLLDRGADYNALMKYLD